MASDFLKILQEVRGTGAPEAVATDGIYWELTSELRNGNLGIYGDMVSMHTELGSLAADVTTITDNLDTISAVGAAITDIGTVSTNIVDIQNAEANATAANAAKVLAEEWAEQTVDVEITGNPGSFSSKHYNIKAAESLVGTTADKAQTALDVAATATNVTATNADVVTTAANVASTAQDSIDTAADSVSTNADKVAVAADLASTNQDTLATAANLAATALDVIATAADRVQTGIDVGTTASNVTASQTALGLAESARDAAAASADMVDDLFLGPKAADPLVDNDGDVLSVGSIYYNTTLVPKQLKIWDGATWTTAVFDASGAVISFNGRDGLVTLTLLDIETVLGFTVNEYTSTEKIKLGGIADSANNYVHPASHTIVEITGLDTALAAKVDDSQVLTDVPAGALFTDSDTVYDDTAIQAAVALNTAKVSNVDHPLVETAVPIGAVFTDNDTIYDDTAILASVALNTAKVTYPSADSSKLAGIEAGATADQTLIDLGITKPVAEVNGISPILTAPIEKVIAIPALDIAVNSASVFTKTITADTVFTISGVNLTPGNVNSFDLVLTNGGASLITFPSGFDVAGLAGLTSIGVDSIGFKTIDNGVTWLLHGYELDIK